LESLGKVQRKLIAFHKQSSSVSLLNDHYSAYCFSTDINVIALAFARII